MRLRRPDGVQRVVGQVERRAEHGEHAVADEFVERALVQEDRVGHAAEEDVQQHRDLLRRQVLGHAGEADEIREQHRQVAFLRDERRVGFRRRL